MVAEVFLVLNSQVLGHNFTTVLMSKEQNCRDSTPLIIIKNCYILFVTCKPPLSNEPFTSDKEFLQLQWNLDLMKRQGTMEIGSLYCGSVLYVFIRLIRQG